MQDATTFLIEGGEHEDEEDDTNNNATNSRPLIKELEQNVVEEQAEITLYAFSGWKGPCTMKLQAFTGKYPVTVF